MVRRIAYFRFLANTTLPFSDARPLAARLGHASRIDLLHRDIYYALHFTTRGKFRRRRRYFCGRNFDAENDIIYRVLPIHWREGKRSLYGRTIFRFHVMPRTISQISGEIFHFV